MCFSCFLCFKTNNKVSPQLQPEDNLDVKQKADERISKVAEASVQPLAMRPVSKGRIRLPRTTSVAVARAPRSSIAPEKLQKKTRPPTAHPSRSKPQS